MIIKLTTGNMYRPDPPIYVNMDFVASITSMAQGSCISMANGEKISVIESPETILGLAKIDGYYDENSKMRL